MTAAAGWQRPGQRRHHQGAGRRRRLGKAATAASAATATGHQHQRLGISNDSCCGMMHWHQQRQLLGIGIGGGWASALIQQLLKQRRQQRGIQVGYRDRLLPPSSYH
jgi:hypothetical protein